MLCCVMLQIYSYGLQPYYGYSNQDAVELIRTHQLLACPAGCPPRLYAVMVDCWHPSPSTRPRFDDVRRRLRDCAVVGSGSGSASVGSATAAGCCGTDGLYQPHPFCPPAACIQHSDAQCYAAHPLEQCPPEVCGGVQDRTDDAQRRLTVANGDAFAVGVDGGTVLDGKPGTRSKPPTSSVVCARPCSSANRSTTPTTASTARNSQHQARSSSSSASDVKSRQVTSSELDRLTSHPRPR